MIGSVFKVLRGVGGIGFIGDWGYDRELYLESELGAVEEMWGVSYIGVIEHL